VHASEDSRSEGKVRRRLKRKKGMDLAKEQYQQLREKLHSTDDIREKNVIYRRLTNLLDVLQFLNSHKGMAN